MRRLPIVVLLLSVGLFANSCSPLLHGPSDGESAHHALAALDGVLRHWIERGLQMLVCVPDSLRTAAVMVARFRRRFTATRCGFCGFAAPVALALMIVAGVMPARIAVGMFIAGSWIAMICHAVHLVVELARSARRHWAIK